MFASIEYQIFANCVVFSESLPVRIIFKTGFLSWSERFSFKKPAVIVLKAEESIPQMISSLENPWRHVFHNNGGFTTSPASTHCFDFPYFCINFRYLCSSCESCSSFEIVSVTSYHNICHINPPINYFARLVDTSNLFVNKHVCTSLLVLWWTCAMSYVFHNFWHVCVCVCTLLNARCIQLHIILNVLYRLGVTVTGSK